MLFMKGLMDKIVIGGVFFLIGALLSMARQPAPDVAATASPKPGVEWALPEGADSDVKIGYGRVSLDVVEAGEVDEGVPEDRLLTLVNDANPLPEDWQMSLVYIDGSHQMDASAADSLLAMLDAAEAEGLDPLVCSAYRTREKQEQLFQNRVQRCRDEGLRGEDAVREAMFWVARPDRSEHQMGLAADIVSVGNQRLDDSQLDTATQQWLMAHCWEYGFILRYPPEKSDITGIGHEPWHYRYVGREAAEAITESGLCLEEWLDRQ